MYLYTHLCMWVLCITLHVLPSLLIVAVQHLFLTAKINKVGYFIIFDCKNFIKVGYKKCLISEGGDAIITYHTNFGRFYHPYNWGIYIFLFSLQNSTKLAHKVGIKKLNQLITIPMILRKSASALSIQYTQINIEYYSFLKFASYN